MTAKQKVFLYFFGAGFLGGVCGTAFLWQFIGTEHSYWIIGFRERWVLFAFPIAGAILAGLWALYLYTPGFGALRGAAVSLLAFLTFTLVLTLLGPAGFQGGFANGLNVFFRVVVAYTFFGFIIVGWVIVAIGALTGWLFRTTLVKHPNKSTQSTGSAGG
jgi:hypothetical protein